MQIAPRRRKDSPSYGSWHSMRQRCNNPNDKDYPAYGARDIQVCERWDDFTLFLKDMGEKPTPRHSIDRVNNDGNYEPDNCRWATPKEQTHNSRVCKIDISLANEIREIYSTGQITQTKLAARYNINQSVISRIITREIW